MKSRTRAIIELIIVIVIAVWVAAIVQWKIRHPGERLGHGAEQQVAKQKVEKPE